MEQIERDDSTKEGQVDDRLDNLRAQRAIGYHKETLHSAFQWLSKCDAQTRDNSATTLAPLRLTTVSGACPTRKHLEFLAIMFSKGGGIVVTFSGFVRLISSIQL